MSVARVTEGRLKGSDCSGGRGRGKPAGGQGGGGMAGMRVNVNVGVLGHIDSGKTALARALSTTASTAAFDKQPQSRERGITLDLGFSCFSVPLPARLRSALPTSHPAAPETGPEPGEPQLQFTLVDCPGHASLIRTIIGGERGPGTGAGLADAGRSCRAREIASLSRWGRRGRARRTGLAQGPRRLTWKLFPPSTTEQEGAFLKKEKRKKVLYFSKSQDVFVIHEQTEKSTKIIYVKNVTKRSPLTGPSVALFPFPESTTVPSFLRIISEKLI